MELNLSKVIDRIQVYLQASEMGDGLVIRIFNEFTHIGAVAVGEYDAHSSLTSVSVLTRPGHKDDVVAQKAAYTISKSTHQPTCVIAGIHIQDITQDEIKQVLEITEQLVMELLNNYIKK